MTTSGRSSSSSAIAVPEQSAAAQRLFADVKAHFLRLFELDDDAREDALAALSPDVATEVRSLLGHVTTERLIDSEDVLTEDPMGIVGKLVDGRYRVERFVAEGGFSYIYRAEQVRWQRPVALKVFKTTTAAGGMVRSAFVKEGKLLSELSQQTTAIVQSHDIGSIEASGPDGEDALFMALEWLEGRTLAQVCRDEDMRAWPLRRVFAVLDPIAHGLGIAHQNGIAHRDVKPSNIFVIERAGEAIASKLLDFGVAKVAAEHEAGFDGTGGTLKAFTLGYAAPEQMVSSGASSGPWTDVYSLALVASEILAGRRVVEAQNPISAMNRLNDPSRRATPRELGAHLPRSVEKVFRRALSPETEDRYPDVESFWRALKSAAPRSALKPLASG